MREGAERRAAPTGMKSAAPEIQAVGAGPISAGRAGRLTRPAEPEARRAAGLSGLHRSAAAVAREARNPAVGFAFRSPGATEPAPSTLPAAPHHRARGPHRRW